MSTSTNLEEWAPTTHQMARSHIRLNLVYTTYITTSESSSGRGRVPANARKRDRRAGPPDPEVPIQRLRISDAILRFASVRRAPHPPQIGFRATGWRA